MATLDQLEEGIRRAHAAGNVEHVKVLGQVYREMQAQQPAPGNAPSSPAFDAALAAGSQASQMFTSGPVTPRAQGPVSRPDLMGSTATTISGIVNNIPVIGPMSQNASDALLGAGAALMGGDYGETVEGLRTRRQELADANPIANAAGSLVGTIGAYGALAKTANGAHALGLAPGMNMGARIGNGVASGAALDAGTAAFRGRDIGDVAAAGAYGGAVSGIMHPVASIASAGARAVGDVIAPRIAAITRPVEEAGRRTGNAFLRDRRMAPDDMIGSADEVVAREANIPLLNVDRGGETIRALARSVANQNPEARQIITRAADDRFNSQGLRAVDFVRRLTGGSADDLAYQQNIRDMAKLVNTPRYQAAWAAPNARAVWTPQIRQLMQSPQFLMAVRTAEARGADKAAISGFPAVKNPFTFGPNGAVGLRTNPDGSRAHPSLQFWNQVKINLDGMIERAQRGSKPDRGLYADLTQMKQILVRDLDAAVPEYRSARQGAAAFFDADDALEAGKKFANRPRNVPEARQAFHSFNEAEKKAFQTGYASEIIDRIRSTRDRANVISQVFGNQSSREMAELVFGKGRARELEAYVRVENLADMIRGALGGSTTTRQIMELGLGAGLGGAGGLGVSGGNWGTAAQGAIVGAGLAGARALGRKADDKVMEHIAKLLTSRNPADIQHAINNAAMSSAWMQAIDAIERGLLIAPRATVSMGAGQ